MAMLIYVKQLTEMKIAVSTSFTGIMSHPTQLSNLLLPPPDLRIIFLTATMW
jgi:hypothetical protein